MAIKGMKNLLGRLDRVKSTVEQVTDDVNTFVERRASQCDSGFRSAQLDDAVENDVTVTLDKTSVGNDKEFTIRASGTEVLIIEFGSGIVFPRTNPLPLAQSYPAASYSASHGQWLVGNRLAKFNGWWPVPGTDFWSRGNPSYNVMYLTGKSLDADAAHEIRKVARKVTK